MGGDKELRNAIFLFEHLLADVSDEQVKTAHLFVIPVYDLEDFAESYREVAKASAGTGTRDALEVWLRATYCKCWHGFHCFRLKYVWKIHRGAVWQYRIIAATPHSCDVERLISAHYLIRSPLRSSVSAETIKQFLYVNLNMPDLADFDVRPATKQFLLEKDRRPRLTSSVESSEWYTGVFSEATLSSSTKCCAKFLLHVVFWRLSLQQTRCQ